MESETYTGDTTTEYLVSVERPVVFVSEVAKAVSLSFHYYLPMQNLEKIVDRMSVVVMAPVMDER